MSTDMSIALIAMPADRKQPPDFDEGRRLVEQIDDVALFEFDDPSGLESEIDALLHDSGAETAVLDETGEPRLDIVRRAGVAVINGLEEALASREVSRTTIGGFSIYLSGGLADSDPATEAVEQIENAFVLPDFVLRAMGFVPDCSVPPLLDDDEVWRRTCMLVGRHQHARENFGAIAVRSIQDAAAQAVFTQLRTILATQHLTARAKLVEFEAILGGAA